MRRCIFPLFMVMLMLTACSALKRSKVFEKSRKPILSSYVMGTDVFLVDTFYKAYIDSCFLFHASQWSNSFGVLEMDVLTRKVVKTPSLSSLTVDGSGLSETTFYNCLSSSGDVILSKLVRTDIRDQKILNKMRGLMFDYKFEEKGNQDCFDCFPFIFRISSFR